MTRAGAQDGLPPGLAGHTSAGPGNPARQEMMRQLAMVTAAEARRN